MSALYRHLEAPSFEELRERVCFRPSRALEQKTFEIRELNGLPITRWILLAGLEISHAAVFYTGAQTILPPHIDSDMLGDWCKLNLIFGAPGTMSWYESSDVGTLDLTPDGLPYTHLDPRACKVLVSTRVKRSTLVNPGRPHSLINVSNEGRWALSLVLRENGELVSVDRAYEKLVAVSV